jgi:hypothetical protein
MGPEDVSRCLLSAVMSSTSGKKYFPMVSGISYCFSINVAVFLWLLQVHIFDIL